MGGVLRNVGHINGAGTQLTWVNPGAPQGVH